MKTKFGLLGILLTALLLLTGVRAEAALGADWNSQVITVTGTGLPPAGTRAGQARVLAKRAAIADAYRQLAEIVEGVQVDAQTTVSQMVLASDVVNLKVQAVIKGAQIVSENIARDGAYEVTMSLPMFGAGGLAQAVLEPPAYVEPFPEPQKITTTVTVTVQGGYTGVVIDCRGFRVNPVMSPVIKTTNGQKIYGHENLDYDRVIAEGMAGYADSMNQASRAGSNPLIIKAVRMDDFNANPVVSPEDAHRILSENKSSGFLNQTAVVFLY